MIFAIDFDGTIVENKYPAIGKLNPLLEEFIRHLKRHGHTWILYTMREGKELNEALEFLAMHNLLPDYVNDNVPELIREFGCNPRKVFAHFYIDDHNVNGVALPWYLFDDVRITFKTTADKEQ